MTKLLIASLALAACATQKPAPVTPTPIPDKPAPGTCQASADVIYEIRHQSDTPDVHATSTFRIYSSGYWLFTENEPGGKPGRKLDGCVKDDRLGKIVTTLDGAPWTMTRADVVCQAYSAESIEFEVAGRHVWTDRMCTPEQLDDTSLKALGEAKGLVAQLVPAAK